MEAHTLGFSIDNPENNRVWLLAMWVFFFGLEIFSKFTHWHFYTLLFSHNAGLKCFFFFFKTSDRPHPWEERSRYPPKSSVLVKSRSSRRTYWREHIDASLTPSIFIWHAVTCAHCTVPSKYYKAGIYGFPPCVSLCSRRSQKKNYDLFSARKHTHEIIIIIHSTRKCFRLIYRILRVHSVCLWMNGLPHTTFYMHNGDRKTYLNFKIDVKGESELRVWWALMFLLYWVAVHSRWLYRNIRSCEAWQHLLFILFFIIVEIYGNSTYSWLLLLISNCFFHASTSNHTHLFTEQHSTIEWYAFVAGVLRYNG